MKNSNFFVTGKSSKTNCVTLVSYHILCIGILVLKSLPVHISIYQLEP
jgi:hypothetical protein